VRCGAKSRIDVGWTLSAGRNERSVRGLGVDLDRMLISGHDERLFKRDFCGEILDRHADLELVDYGFAYHRDPKFPQGDITWFLLEKRPA
jgi:hypothetical protein